MTPETHELFHAVAAADASTVQHLLAAGADVNATDELGRGLVAYAALGSAINAVETLVQPRLSEQRLNVLQLVTKHPTMSLYSLNAPMPWAGGVTLLGLMSWLNMPSEIMCLLNFTQGLLEVNAMDEQGATPLMYSARDGNLQVVQRLLAHGARPDLRDISQRSAIQYAITHPQILWLCEESLRHWRQSESTSGIFPPRKRKSRPTTPFPRPHNTHAPHDLFFSPPADRLTTPPPLSWFDFTTLRRHFDMLLRAIHDDDLKSINTILFPLSPNIDRVVIRHRPSFSGVHDKPILINLRDTAGLTLVHHAVAQRRGPNIAILDALHLAGADMGIFSTLGFTPLHHLARTARADASATEDEWKAVENAAIVYRHPMYRFTMHLIRGLHAPLAAKDNRGETPLHAAAEHGRSQAVLQAMLDFDREFFGREAVREARNDRGLRPVDVAKPEFLHFFLGDQSNRKFNPVPSSPHQSHPPAGLSSHNSTPSLRPGHSGLTKRASNTSLLSKSSESSSVSSGTQSYGSQLSQIRFQRPPQCYKPMTPTHTLPTPDPTPPSSFAGSPQFASHPSSSTTTIDAAACTTDLILNLSFCSSTLEAYKQPPENEHLLPDLLTVSDTLVFSRDLGYQVLEHWAGRLDSARDEFERTKRDFERTDALRHRIARYVRAAKEKKAGMRLRAGELSFGRTTPQARRVGVAADADADPVAGQTDVDASAPEPTSSSSPTARTATLSYHRQGDPDRIDDTEETPAAQQTEEHQGPSPSISEKHEKTSLPSILTNNTAKTAKIREDDKDRSDSTAAPARRKGGKVSLKLNIASRADDDAVSTEASRSPTLVKFPALQGPPPRRASIIDSTTYDSQRVLRRADADVRELITLLALVQQSFIRAQQAIGDARAYLEDALKVREDQLHVLFRIYHQQELPNPSSRLSPILERSSDSGHNLAQVSSSGYEFANFETASYIHHHAAVLQPISEPNTLRRLLTRKIIKYIEGVFDDIERSHVWLRIIREVLRGLRRRAALEQ